MGILLLYEKGVVVSGRRGRGGEPSSTLKSGKCCFFPDPHQQSLFLPPPLHPLSPPPSSKCIRIQNPELFSLSSFFLGKCVCLVPWAFFRPPSLPPPLARDRDGLSLSTPPPPATSIRIKILLQSPFSSIWGLLLWQLEAYIAAAVGSRGDICATGNKILSSWLSHCKRQIFEHIKTPVKWVEVSLL